MLSELRHRVVKEGGVEGGDGRHGVRAGGEGVCGAGGVVD